MCKYFFAVIFCALLLCSCKTSSYKTTKNTFAIDTLLKGNFTDDYAIAYTVNDTIFLQHPTMRYRLIKWNEKEQYFIAKNTLANKGDTTTYTKIDYMYFTNMQPYNWGFCYTTYNAKTIKEAEKKAKADKSNPRKGCGGYPFSRMKRDK